MAEHRSGSADIAVELGVAKKGGDRKREKELDGEMGRIHAITDTIGEEVDAILDWVMKDKTLKPNEILYIGMLKGRWIQQITEKARLRGAGIPEGASVKSVTIDGDSKEGKALMRILGKGIPGGIRDATGSPEDSEESEEEKPVAKKKKSAFDTLYR